MISDTLQAKLSELTDTSVCVKCNVMFVNRCVSRRLTEPMVASKTMDAEKMLFVLVQVSVLTLRALQRVSGSWMPVISLSWLISMSLC